LIDAISIGTVAVLPGRRCFPASLTRRERDFWGEGSKEAEMVDSSAIETYSAAAVKHFMSPLHTEAIVDVNGIGCASSSHMEDLIELAIRVDHDGIIDGVRCRAFGCVAAVACGSVFSGMLPGKTLTQAAEISADQVLDGLGGLPPRRVGYARLPILALEAAIANNCERAMTASKPKDRSFAHRRAPRHVEETI
jgi:nitrogen fixation protein NifU and related proteins